MALWSTMFTVTGTGTFPIDMLRYDRCCPVDPAAVSAIIADPLVIERTFDAPRHINLLTFHPTKKGGHITPDRWESFGWKVTDRQEPRSG